jgi:diguanylate cyclase (GGDEF)-like protein/PAS domain S-box-containing protein
MTDRTELLETALDSLPDGMALVSAEGSVVFWNQAAYGITGYAPVEVLTQALPVGLERLFFEERGNGVSGTCVAPPEGRRALVQARHKLGHGVPVIARVLVLRDGLGGRIGAAALFHPAESLDALPHGETGEGSGVEGSRAEFLERLQLEFDELARGGPHLGILWVGVDQAKELRKTHGAAACQAMLEKVRRALAQGLRPAEEIGCWGDDEFLILAHERSAEMLAAHAQTLAGLARTADFRWWGDRVSLSVSIGAAQAAGDCAETLAQLLERARQAMEASNCVGGNRATIAAASNPEPAPVEDATCLPS